MAYTCLLYVCVCVCVRVFVCAWVPACLNVFDRHASYVRICAYLCECLCECECAVCVYVCVCGYLIGESVWRRDTRLASAQQVIDQSHAPATHVKKKIVRNQHSRRKINEWRCEERQGGAMGSNALHAIVKKTKKKHHLIGVQQLHPFCLSCTGKRLQFTPF